MLLEAVIDQVQRCTLRPSLSEVRDAIRDLDPASFEMNFKAEIE